MRDGAPSRTRVVCAHDCAPYSASHATKQATACAAVKKDSPALQQLRSELEVAGGKASEAQEATEELRQQLQQEKVSRLEVEHLLELQREALLREFHQRKACEAEVANFLRLLGQRYPELACSVVTGSIRCGPLQVRVGTCKNFLVLGIDRRVISRKARAEL